MDFYPLTQKMIVRELSADSRATVTELSKAANCSRVTVTKQLKNLEKSLGIKYTIEVDETKLGTTERHLITVKFSKKPDTKLLKAFFAKEQFAQQVYLTEGDFDLIIYARAGDPVSYIRWETYISSELSEYGAVIRPSEFVLSHFGYFPLQDDFVDDIKSIKLSEKDKKILKLLNENSRMSFTEISKKAGLERGTTRYRIFNLRKTGIIKRFTIAVQNPPKKYIAAYFVNYRFNKTTQERSAMARSSYMNADEGVPLLNTFQILAPTSGSYRFFTMALFENRQEALDRAIKEHARIFSKENVEIKEARITEVIKGLLPFRNLDVKSNYTLIQWK